MVGGLSCPVRSWDSIRCEYFDELGLCRLETNRLDFAGSADHHLASRRSSGWHLGIPTPGHAGWVGEERKEGSPFRSRLKYA
jgi:hypothetical protein